MIGLMARNRDTITTQKGRGEMNEIETLKEIIQNEKDLMYATGSLEGADVRSGNEICLRNIAALEFALETLREKAEREKGCKVCNGAFLIEYNQYSHHECEKSGKAVICPNCGRKLKED